MFDVHDIPAMSIGGGHSRKLLPSKQFVYKSAASGDDGKRALDRLISCEARMLRAVSSAFNRARSRVPLDDLATLIADVMYVHSGTPHGEFHSIVAASDVVALQIGQGICDAVLDEASESAWAERIRIEKLHMRKSMRKDATTVNVDFTAANSRALSELSYEQLKQIQALTIEQRQAVLDILRRDMANGLNPNVIARDIRNVVGLTAKQIEAVGRYEAALQKAHLDAAARNNALNRGLRDGRFDRTIRSAAATGKALTQAQIDKMVERYTQRYIDYRAKVIARTEALRAVHAGEAAAWEEAINSGKINASQVIQRWVTCHDSRVRHTHSPMDGQRRKWGELFASGAGVPLRYPGDWSAPPEEVCNCRCVVVRYLGPASGDEVAQSSAAATAEAEAEGVGAAEEETAALPPSIGSAGESGEADTGSVSISGDISPETEASGSATEIPISGGITEAEAESQVGIDAAAATEEAAASALTDTQIHELGDLATAYLIQFGEMPFSENIKPSQFARATELLRSALARGVALSGAQQSQISG
jgi:hypothetical protein